MRLCWAFLLLAGCFAPRGHYDPDQRRVCVRDVCYRLGPLPDWRLVRQKSGEVAFFDDRAGAVAQANATCRDDSEAAPLEVLMRHLLIGYTEIRPRLDERLRLDGREALHRVVEARLDGVLMVLDLYVLKRDGCIFDLSLAAPPERYPEAAPLFSRFVSGFRQERRS